MMQTVGFAVIAACALSSALLVVRSRRLIRAVLWLGVTLVATAALYAMLGASFLAGAQVLVYVGGVVTLMIIGVMVTRRHEGITVEIESARSGRAALLAVGLFGVVAYAIRATPELDASVETTAVTPSDLGRALLGQHVLAFEVMSFLLLAAIVGAIVIARRRDPAIVTAATPHAPPKEAS